VPRRRRSHSRKSKQNTQCQYFGNSWPYFSCGQNPGQNGALVQQPRVKRSTCQQCLNYPYGYILQNGLPTECAGCFQGFGAPMMPIYNSPYMYNPFMPYPPYGNFPGYNNNGNNDGNIYGSNNGNNNENNKVDSNIAGSGDDGWIALIEIFKEVALVTLVTKPLPKNVKAIFCFRTFLINRLL